MPTAIGIHDGGRRWGDLLIYKRPGGIHMQLKRVGALQPTPFIDIVIIKGELVYRTYGGRDLNGPTTTPTDESQPSEVRDDSSVRPSEMGEDVPSENVPEAPDPGVGTRGHDGSDDPE